MRTVSFLEQVGSKVAEILSPLYSVVPRFVVHGVLGRKSFFGEPSIQLLQPLIGDEDSYRHVADSQSPFL
jgi:hypothetical protein